MPIARDTLGALLGVALLGGCYGSDVRHRPSGPVDQGAPSAANPYVDQPPTMRREPPEPAFERTRHDDPDRASSQ